MTMLGKYTLVRKLATGGMAEVFLARADGPMGFQKQLVVKRILPHFAEDQQFVQMFLGEARLAAQLNHPNLVQIFDFGQADGQYYLAMEYIDGPNLRVLNRAMRESDGPVPLAIAARIICLAAEGLHFAHELRDEDGRPTNLVHRDISPDNVLVSRTGGVKVVDFGIAKASTQPHLTKSGVIKGKMAYMPPEQLAREELDRRADIFALGVVLYELVVGSMPFDATSEVSIIQAIMGQGPLERVRAHRPDVPPELDAIIARCLEKNRELRYATCLDLQRDLERFIQSTGQVVSSGDVGALVSRLFPSDREPTLQRKLPEGATDGLDSTTPSMKSPVRPSSVQSAPSGGTGTSVTSLRPVSGLAPAPTTVEAQPKPVPLALLVVGGLALLALGASAVVLLRPPPAPPPVVTAPPVVAVVPPSLPAVPPPPAIVDAGPELDAGPEASPDAGPEDAGPPELDAGPATAVEPAHPAAARTGTVEFRVRPYATISVDGRLLGDTPLPAQTLSVGKHKVHLVNADLGKDLSFDLTVHPGENTVKYNLKE
jgi:serine/threonine-protein kinase